MRDPKTSPFNVKLILAWSLLAIVRPQSHSTKQNDSQLPEWVIGCLVLVLIGAVIACIVFRITCQNRQSDLGLEYVESSEQQKQGLLERFLNDSVAYAKPAAAALNIPPPVARYSQNNVAACDEHHSHDARAGGYVPPAFKCAKSV